MTNPNLTPQSGCEYDVLDGDIHYFLWHSSDRVAVDEFIGHYRHMLETSDKNTTLRMIVDARTTDVPPLRYTYTRFQALFKELYTPKVRSIFLFNNLTMLSLIQAFLDMLRLDAHHKFMTGDNTPDDTSFDEAIAWVLEE